MLDDRGRAADESEKAGWFDRAIESYERSLKLRPDDAGTQNGLTATLLLKWRVVADSTEKDSLLTRAAATIERAFALDASASRYNYACVSAVRGEPDRALEELRKLLQEDPAKRQQIAKDEDFGSLAEHPGFRELIGESRVSR